MNEEQFRKVIALLSSYKPRSEITLDEIPAPQKLAKYAFALSADVSNGLLGDDERELANGRFVILHEPGGQETWEGEFRCVTYMNADLETTEAEDPTLPEHGWNWLLKALEDNGCHIAAPSGTVTRVVSVAYGMLEGRDEDSEMEVRASWTPTSGEEIAHHVQAWLDLLSLTAALEPIPEGVTQLTPGRR